MTPPRTMWGTTARTSRRAPLRRTPLQRSALAAAACMGAWLASATYCAAEEPLGFAWEGGLAPFVVNPNLPDVELSGTPEEQLDIILCAAAAWRDQTRAEVELAFQGTTSARGVDLNDGQNTISWIDQDGDGALAATFFRPKKDGFDIVLFGRSKLQTGEELPIRWSGPGEPPPGTVDIAGIVTHELGHAIGLGHVDELEATMFPSARQRGLPLRTLHEVDRTCVESIYGLRTEEQPGVEVLAAMPAVGDVRGGMEVVVEGLNFTWKSETQITLDGKPLDAEFWEPDGCNRIRILDMPPHAAGPIDIRVTNSLGSGLGEALFTYEGELPPYRRADVNGDAEVNISDAQMILGVLFLGSPRRFLCEKSGDTNDSGAVDVSDASFLLEHLFLGGPAPGAPSDACGTDPTDDGLSCGGIPACE